MGRQEKIFNFIHIFMVADRWPKDSRAVHSVSGCDWLRTPAKVSSTSVQASSSMRRIRWWQRAAWSTRNHYGTQLEAFPLYMMFLNKGDRWTGRIAYEFTPRSGDEASQAVVLRRHLILASSTVNSNKLFRSRPRALETTAPMILKFSRDRKSSAFGACRL